MLYSVIRTFITYNLNVSFFCKKWHIKFVQLADFNLIKWNLYWIKKNIYNTIVNITTEIIKKRNTFLTYEVMFLNILHSQVSS